ncbi:MAG: hypothetical protein ACYTAF_11800, partial [Planctomycetota bacterium]
MTTLLIIIAAMACLLLGPAIVLAVRSGALKGTGRAKGTPQVLRAFEQKFGGKVRDIDGAPVLFIERPLFEAIVERPSKSVVSLTARPKGAYRGRMQVQPTTMRSTIARFFGEEDLAVGDPMFDPRFYARGNPEDFAREALSSDTRSLFRAIDRHGDAVLTVNPKRLQVQLTRAPRRGRALMEAIDVLISCGLQIAEVIPATAVKEEVVIIATETHVSRTVCQVC